jgi:hypothetical protein
MGKTYSPSPKKAVAATLLLLISVSMVYPVSPVGAQTILIIVVNIDQTEVNLTVNQSTNNEGLLTGEVNITKPISKLITVDVFLTVTVQANLSVYIDPPTMKFQDSGSQSFVVHVVVPSDLKNRSQAVVKVEGTTSTSQLPTETDFDTAVIFFSYPPDNKPNPAPTDNSTTGQDFLPQTMAFCGVSALFGLCIGALLYWKKRRDKERSTQVIYVPRPPKEGQI